MEYDFDYWIDFIYNEFELDQIQRIAEFGFDFAAPNDWVFYDKAVEFYNDNMDIMEQVFEDVVFQFWVDEDVPSVIHAISKGSNNEWHNVKQSILTYLVEEACNIIILDMEDEMVDD